jgi:light-regulated signal transduction histidine kinase (bacteriophytochrome)
MPADMNETVQAVLKEITMTEGPSPADITLEALSPCVCDPSLIRQVWINLVSNALKFSSKKETPKIRISSTLEGNMVKYSVEDNGAGFDPRYKEKLFGVFQRLHTQNEFEGTGIGLANVKRIVIRHGGHVDATSEPGKGATFSFWLPVNLPN